MKLKNKKGFTLIELIVVIAIIGVLAAILVPLMTGFVTNAKVTSANKTASSIKTIAEIFLTEASSAGYGIKPGEVQMFKVRAYIDSDGKQHWRCTPADKNKFYGDSSVSWGTEGNYTGGVEMADLDKGEDRICSKVSELLPTVKSCSIVVYLAGRSCSFVAYTTDTDEYLIESQYPTVTNGFANQGYSWNGDVNGLNDDGFVVGTCPIITFA